jgi:hypothetical protein
MFQNTGELFMNTNLPPQFKYAMSTIDPDAWESTWRKPKHSGENKAGKKGKRKLDKKGQIFMDRKKPVAIEEEVDESGI